MCFLLGRTTTIQTQKFANSLLTKNVSKLLVARPSINSHMYLPRLVLKSPEAEVPLGCPHCLFTDDLFCFLALMLHASGDLLHLCLPTVGKLVTPQQARRRNYTVFSGFSSVFLYFSLLIRLLVNSLFWKSEKKSTPKSILTTPPQPPEKIIFKSFPKTCAKLLKFYTITFTEPHAASMKGLQCGGSCQGCRKGGGSP